MKKWNQWMKGVALTLILTVVAGCTTPAVQRVRPNYWAKQLADNALTTRHLSESSSTLLALRGWDKKDLKQPQKILHELRQELCRHPDRAGLIAFAEFAYLNGLESNEDHLKEAYLLTAARAAYAAVFDPDMGPALDPLNPHLRFAADLYNYSLSLLVDRLLESHIEGNSIEGLPLVEGRINLLRGHGMNQARDFDQVLIAFSHKTKALRNQNRRRGIGVPVIAVRPGTVLVEGLDLQHPPVCENSITPATLLIRFHEPWRTSDPELSADIELWNPLNSPYVKMGDRHVPLEADSSLSLAMAYETHAEYRGIKNMLRFLRGGFVAESRGLYLMEPYSPDKIPLVFTHGLMDSPLTWVPMLNELYADPVISERYQFWVFFYPTVNPILQSASELRQSILSLKKKLTSEGTEWDDMVFVGHSMGGLISRLMITESGDHFNPLKERSRALTQGDPELQRYTLSLGTFDPLPTARRAIFMGAPHKGASMAIQPAGRLGSHLISQPDYIRTFFDAKEGRLELINQMEDGIQNLAPDSLFTQALQKTSWPTSTTVHSVIGDFWAADRTNGTDTVVNYSSSHLEGVESELVVHADHLTLHKKMPAIAEVRRILLKHVGK